MNKVHKHVQAPKDRNNRLEINGLMEKFVYGDFVKLLVSCEGQYILTCSSGKWQASDSGCMPDGWTCALTVDTHLAIVSKWRQWTHILQLDDDISASELSIDAYFVQIPWTPLHHNWSYGYLLSAETAQLRRMSSTQSIWTTQQSRFCSFASLPLMQLGGIVMFTSLHIPVCTTTCIWCRYIDVY